MNNLDRLINILCAERGETAPTLSEEEKRGYFRALCNVRPPEPVDSEFLRLQDEYLKEETLRRGIVDVNGFEYRQGIALWRGDITRLNADAVVNACNPALLGCFSPLHNCIDNIIHSNAGVQVRLDCAAMMRGGSEPNGSLKVTKAYNLPSKFIFHTVGPRVFGEVGQKDEKELESCYKSCMDRAAEDGLSSIAFCCISTGVYGFPQYEACRIAVAAVKERLARGGGVRVIFDVFTDRDADLYERELFGKNRKG